MEKEGKIDYEKIKHFTPQKIFYRGDILKRIGKWAPNITKEQEAELENFFGDGRNTVLWNNKIIVLAWQLGITYPTLISAISKGDYKSLTIPLMMYYKLAVTERRRMKTLIAELEKKFKDTNVFQDIKQTLEDVYTLYPEEQLPFVEYLETAINELRENGE